MKVTLYHGSDGGIRGAIAPRSKDMCDFGRGFYMGTEPSQPKTLICEDREPVFYTLSAETEGLNVVDFAPDLDWAFFVAFNRGFLTGCEDTPFFARYAEIRETADVIRGKIANDRIYDTLTRFFDNGISDETCLACLKAVNLGDQWCAVTPRACAAIGIVSSERLSAAECETLRAKARNQRRRAASETERLRLALFGKGRPFAACLEAMKAEGRDRP